MQQKLIILAATGQNYANVPPLVELYTPGDKILVLESVWAKKGARTESLCVFLDQRNMPYRVEVVSDELSEMMSQVAKFCEGYTGWQKVIIANGNTKLFTLALYEALRSHEPAIAYGEREPCMRYFDKGIQSVSKLIPYQHKLDLPDILLVQGQKVFRDEATRVWFQGQRENSSTYENSSRHYGEDKEFTIAYHDAKYFKQGIRDGLKATDRLNFIKVYRKNAWNELMSSSFAFVENCAKLLEVKLDAVNSESVNKALKAIETELLNKPDNSALPSLYLSLSNNYKQHIRIAPEASTFEEWMLEQLGCESLLKPYASYMRMLLKAFGASRASADDPALSERFLQALVSNRPEQLALAQANETVIAIQANIAKIGIYMLEWAEQSNLWINEFANNKRFERSIGFDFEEYVTVRVLNWLDHSQTAKDLVQSVWVNTKLSAKNDKVAHSELDILLVLKNGIVIHLECKSADAAKKDLDARIANLAKLGILSRQVVCLPLYSDYQQTSSYQKMMKKFADFCVRNAIDFIAVDLPNQTNYEQLQSRESTLHVPRFDDALEKLIAPYQLTL